MSALPMPFAMVPSGRRTPPPVAVTLSAHSASRDSRMRPNLIAVAVALSGAFAAPFAHGADLPDKAEVTREAEALLARAWPADGPGGVVLVARGDEILFEGARGLADLEAGTVLDVDDTFRLGSITKQFAAAGLLKLVEDDKVALDDPLSKYLPAFPNGDAITVRQLLDHTSGVKSYTSIPGYFADGIQADLDTGQLVAVFRDLPVDFAPGAVQGPDGLAEDVFVRDGVDSWAGPVRAGLRRWMRR